MSAEDRWEEATAEVRRRLEEGRRNGLYPDELDVELASQFARAGKDPLAFETFDRLRSAIAAVRDVDLSATPAPSTSDLPGGQVLHRTIARLMARQVQALLRQVSTLTAALADGFDATTASLDELRTVVTTDVFGDIDAIHHRLVAVEHRLERLRLDAAETPDPADAEPT